jgi:hypothetical protein
VISIVSTKVEYDLDHFPVVKEWLGKMLKREAIKNAVETKKPE